MQRINLTVGVFLIFWSVNAYPQKAKAVNFFNKIRNDDLSLSLNADTILTEGEEGGLRKVKRAEILGFIGNDYQRFQIHFISIIKNPKNAYQYFASGKTMVKGKICSFKGTITIKEVELHKSNLPNYQQGSATCDILLDENKNEFNSGFIKGRLTSNFTIDDKKRFRYDALMLVSDNFSNNQFVGTWTNYKTNVSKKCNWGDYRIPDGGDLDNGAGEFYVSNKYLKNGWESYMRELKLFDKGKPEKATTKSWWR